MMQRLSLLLGHPLYSLVVVLAGLLAATGLGALASGRLATRRARRARWPAAGRGRDAIVGYSLRGGAAGGRRTCSTASSTARWSRWR